MSGFLSSTTAVPTHDHPDPHGAQNDLEPTKLTIQQRIFPMQTDDMNVRWARRILGMCFAVTLLCAICEAWIMINQRAGRDELLEATDDDDTYDSIWLSFRAEMTFNSVFLMSIGFGFFVTWDGVMQHNTLQILSMNAYNTVLFVYSIAQIYQANKDRDMIEGSSAVAQNTGSFFAALVTLPVLLGLYIPAFAYLTSRLYRDQAWRMYRITNGNVAMIRIFSFYHTELLLLKFSALFVSGFTVIALALTPVTAKGMIIIPSAGAVVGLVCVLSGFYGLRYEHRSLFAIFEILCLVVLAYLAERIYRAFSLSDDSFERAVAPFLMYGILGGLLVIAATIYGGLCWWNFDQGLKEVLDQEVRRKTGTYQVPIPNLDE